MFYIFNAHGSSIGYCDLEPNLDDLAERGEFVVESDLMYSNKLEYKEGKIFEIPSIEESLTDQELLELKRLNYPKLTRYQFFRGLLECGYDSDVIEGQINLIPDEYRRKLAIIGFKDAGYFVRMDSSVTDMKNIMGISDDDLDSFWEYSLKL